MTTNKPLSEPLQKMYELLHVAPQGSPAYAVVRGGIAEIERLQEQVRFLSARRDAATEELRRLGHDVGGL